MSSPAQFSISAGPLQLLWEWQGDRFGHRLLFSDASSGVDGLVLLESVEGSPNEAWPDSPPLQECHVESRSDGRTVALLVGRAGKSHWSLSVLADPAAASLLFEAACRLAEEPLWLGSRYRALYAKEPTGPHDVFLEVLDIGERWPLAEAASTFPEKTGQFPWRELAVAAPLDRAAWPRTVQWRYRVCVGE